MADYEDDGPADDYGGDDFAEVGGVATGATTRFDPPQRSSSGSQCRAAASSQQPPV